MFQRQQLSFSYTPASALTERSLGSGVPFTSFTPVFASNVKDIRTVPTIPKWATSFCILGNCEEKSRSLHSGHSSNRADEGSFSIPLKHRDELRR